MTEHSHTKPFAVAIHDESDDLILQKEYDTLPQAPRAIVYLVDTVPFAYTGYVLRYDTKCSRYDWMGRKLRYLPEISVG